MKTTKIRKTYRALNSSRYSIQLNVGKRSVLVTFLQCNPVGDEKAMYTTEDPHVQEALENASVFNREYYLERQVNHVEDAPVVPSPVVETVAEAGGGTPEGAAPDDEAGGEATGKTVEDAEREAVTSSALAKAFLIEKFADDKAEIAALKKADEVKAYATEKGVVFPNWA